MKGMNRNNHCASCGGKIPGKPIWKTTQYIYSGGIRYGYVQNPVFMSYCSDECVDADCEKYKCGEMLKMPHLRKGKWGKPPYTYSNDVEMPVSAPVEASTDEGGYTPPETVYPPMTAGLPTK